jgi:hypothetical protein
MSETLKNGYRCRVKRSKPPALPFKFLGYTIARGVSNGQKAIEVSDSHVTIPIALAGKPLREAIEEARIAAMKSHCARLADPAILFRETREGAEILYRNLSARGRSGEEREIVGRSGDIVTVTSLRIEPSYRLDRLYGNYFLGRSTS